MARSFGNKNASSLLKLVQERALSNKVEEEKRKQENLVPYLSKDCISMILLRLPITSLSSTRFVCKSWYNIINTANFINAHLRCSESVLIFLKSSITHPIPTDTFSVEAGLLPSNHSSIFGYPLKSSRITFCIQFMRFEGGKSKIEEYKISCLASIRAACNGLILLDNSLKKGGLLVMNPVTRKLIALPVGTLSPAHDESYGFALSQVTGLYKLVHLFRDAAGYVGCEILTLGKIYLWREVNGPSFGLFGWFGYRPVSAIGAFHWLPQIDRSDYIVSMEVDHEKFHTVPLPRTSRIYDRIVENGGFLCFVTHEELNIDIWILKGLCGEVWTKHHTITTGCIIDMVPLFCLRISGDMIFMRDEDRSFYAYNAMLQVMIKVEMENTCVSKSVSYLPHVSSLVSWEKMSRCE